MLEVVNVWEGRSNRQVRIRSLEPERGRYAHARLQRYLTAWVEGYARKIGQRVPASRRITFEIDVDGQPVEFSGYAVGHVIAVSATKSNVSIVVKATGPNEHMRLQRLSAIDPLLASTPSPPPHRHGSSAE